MDIHLQESLNCLSVFPNKSSAHIFGTHTIKCVLFSRMGTEKFLARLRLNSTRPNACQSIKLEKFKLCETEIPKFQNAIHGKTEEARKLNLE